jgi:putative ABC transport system substrate-binding protein
MAGIITHPAKPGGMNRKRFVEFAATHRIPAMYERNFIVQEGGLCIDRIFKGANPADFPAEPPTRYYFAVNLKTAATLGLTMPPSLLLRTDEASQ